MVMKTFQFSVSRIDNPLEEAKDENGNLILTPIVTAETITQAMNSEEVQNFCNENGYRIFRPVRK
jgi:hypothetical protein